MPSKNSARPARREAGGRVEAQVDLRRPLGDGLGQVVALHAVLGPAVDPQRLAARVHHQAPRRRGDVPLSDEVAARRVLRHVVGQEARDVDLAQGAEGEGVGLADAARRVVLHAAREGIVVVQVAHGHGLHDGAGHELGARDLIDDEPPADRGLPDLRGVLVDGLRAELPDLAGLGVHAQREQHRAHVTRHRLDGAGDAQAEQVVVRQAQERDRGILEVEHATVARSQDQARVVHRGVVAREHRRDQHRAPVQGEERRALARDGEAIDDGRGRDVDLDHDVDPRQADERVLAVGVDEQVRRLAGQRHERERRAARRVQPHQAVAVAADDEDRIDLCRTTVPGSEGDRSPGDSHAAQQVSRRRELEHRAVVGVRDPQVARRGVQGHGPDRGRHEVDPGPLVVVEHPEGRRVLCGGDGERGDEERDERRTNEGGPSKGARTHGDLEWPGTAGGGRLRHPSATILARPRRPELLEP